MEAGLSLLPAPAGTDGNPSRPMRQNLRRTLGAGERNRLRVDGKLT
jgi:hypothetical protein